MTEPKTYLSRSEGKFRVIHAGAQIAPDTSTESDALAAAKRFGLTLSSRVWDGDSGAFVDMRFTVRECGKGPIVAGLEGVPANNANVTRLAPDVPLSSLAVGEQTIGRAGSKEAYEIVRVA